jgi:ABC-2 type transport system permease protein
MSTVLALARADVTSAWRDGRIPALFALCALLGGFSAWASGLAVARTDRERAAAQHDDYATWLSQRAGNPHSFAHFGLMAFKPSSALHAFDPGVSAYLGTSIWLEAHWQDPAGDRPAESSLDATRIAELSPAFLLATIGPLVVVALGFSSFARERENGAWRMLLAAGLSARGALAARVCSLAAASAFALLPLAAASVFAVAMAARGSVLPEDFVVRALGLGALQVANLGAFGAATLAVSAGAPSARSAFATLVALWLVAGFGGPRVAAAAADRASPAPSAAAYWAEVGAALRSGLDGHDPASERARAFERRVLAEYGVSRKEDLPVSFAGLSLAESEAYGNRVFDAHFARLYAVFERQRKLARAFSWLSPAIAVREASQLLSGADERHHRHFAAAAEAHRRSVVALLNEDMIRHAAGKDFDYLAEPELWARIPAFAYALPSLRDVAPPRSALTASFLVCAGWILGFGALALRNVQRWSSA